MSQCTPNPFGDNCATPSSWSSCKPWSLTDDGATNCFMDSTNDEGIQIAGATLNIYKLLGIHEQTKLTDLTGFGSPISGGDAAEYPSSHAFSTYATSWRSKQTGAAVLTSAYIGYDFGIKRLSNGRQRYGVDAPIRHTISTIKIKQSANAASRVTQARVERSDDGVKWYGVAIVALPDNDALNIVHFKATVPSRYWRIRPLQFVGQSCDRWEIQALEMAEHEATDLTNIQDQILMENRDRDYSPPFSMKGYYNVVSSNMDLSRFGIEIPTTYTIRVNFTRTILEVGRPIVVGDIIELPSETQFTPDLRPVKKYLEVTDVTWDSDSFTPGWRPLMLLITAQPALASQETRDIFGDLTKDVVDSSGLFDSGDGNASSYQDITAIAHTIRNAAADQVPERGSEGSNVIREFTEAELAAADAQGASALRTTNFNRTAIYVEDAMPQNGAPYTEGPSLPTDNLTDGQYHRLTYEGLAKDVPARLYRYSSAKSRWIYLETDRRQEFNAPQPVLTEYTVSRSRVFADKIKGNV